MNYIKTAYASLFSSQPAAPRELEQHGLDYDGPTVHSKPAVTSNKSVLKSKAAGTPQPDASPTATQPIYKEKPQAPAGSTNVVAHSSSSQAGPAPASTIAPHANASAFFNAVRNGDLATVRKCIADGIDLSSLKPAPKQPAIAVALKSKNLQMIALLLPVSSHADKLEALASAVGTPPAHRNGMRAGIKAILDSVNRENRPGPQWEKRQDEINLISTLVDK